MTLKKKRQLRVSTLKLFFSVLLAKASKALGNKNLLGNGSCSLLFMPVIFYFFLFLSWWDLEMAHGCVCLFCVQESAKAALKMKDCQMTDRTTQTEHMGPEVSCSQEKYTRSLFSCCQTYEHKKKPHAHLSRTLDLHHVCLLFCKFQSNWSNQIRCTQQRFLYWMFLSSDFSSSSILQISAMLRMSIVPLPACLPNAPQLI